MKKKLAICMAGILAVSVLMSCGSQVGESITEGSADVTNESTDAPDPADSSAETGAATELETGSEDSDHEEAADGSAQEAETENDKEAVILKDGVEKELECFVGTAITSQELGDAQIWTLITTHFNAVTLGNELKPDCMFGYSNDRCPGTEEVDLNGETIVVPMLDYSRSEKILDRLVKWNSDHPDDVIKARGHVLVWHSQTPEWFFHEDYDKNKDYVDAETMNKRLEWYIKTMLTHYTGEDSKYKDVFYGWDVVNEAVSDATGTYRSDSENSEEPLSNDTHGSNSSWWHVYRSNEYIINAFIYANKYAPASLELYYNDYNECMSNKKEGIIELLKAIKEKEGAPGEGTRIDAMGMQGHYQMGSPSMYEFEMAIRAYAAVVGNVQITEMDMKASDGYDGSVEAKEEEFEKQAQRYNTLYWAMKSANKEDNINITGLTFWGTTDRYSWLQSRSDVGGGNKVGLPECPLLFDEMYHPKPAFYVFAGEENK